MQAELGPKNDKVADLRTDILAVHVKDPRDPRHNGKMLQRLYDDGELTLSKGGDLWGNRKEHVERHGNQRRLECVDLPLVTPTNFSYAIIDDFRLAQALQERLSNLLQ